jgi:hypothetical protein
MLNKITTMASCNQSSGSPQSSWNNTLSIWNKPKEYFYNFYNPDSLCPSPWRIPSSDEWREIIKLFTWLYTSSGIWAPFNLPLAWWWDWWGHDNWTAGNYWARDWASSRDNVRIYSTSASVSSNYNSSRELSVRCIK